MNTMEKTEKLVVKSKSLLDIIEKSPFCTSQGSAARVSRWGGYIYICRCQVSSEFCTAKLLKSVAFSQSYSKIKR